MKNRLALIFSLVLITSAAFAQQPAPAPVPDDPNAPVLTHDEKMKLFDFEDQKATMNDEYQKALKKFNEPWQDKFKPLVDREGEYIKLRNEEHPGYELQVVQGRWLYVKATKAPEASKPPAPKK